MIGFVSRIDPRAYARAAPKKIAAAIRPADTNSPVVIAIALSHGMRKGLSCTFGPFPDNSCLRVSAAVAIVNPTTLYASIMSEPRGPWERSRTAPRIPAPPISIPTVSKTLVSSSVRELTSCVPPDSFILSSLQPIDSLGL